MGKLSALRTDPGREVQGVWHDHPEGSRFKIARWGNPAHQAAIDRIREPYLKQIREETLSDEDWDRLIWKPAAAEAVLTDWETEDDDGKPIAFSKELALQYLLDPALRDLWLYVMFTAKNVAHYREQRKEEARKNS